MFNYYEPDDYAPIRECSDCDDKQFVLDSSKDILRNIIEQIYSKKDLDLLKLEEDLDDLCHLLDVPIIAEDINVVRNSSSLNFKLPQKY